MTNFVAADRCMMKPGRSIVWLRTQTGCGCCRTWWQQNVSTGHPDPLDRVFHLQLKVLFRHLTSVKRNYQIIRL